MLTHTIKEGECISSIAEKYGFTATYLLSQNEALRKKRPDMNILLAGDKVHIPNKRMHMEAVSTNTKTRFLRKDIPERMRVILEDPTGKPYADQRYKVRFDTQEEQEDRTTNEGLVEHTIPRGARWCEITLYFDLERQEGTELEAIEATEEFADVWSDTGMDIEDEDGEEDTDDWDKEEGTLVFVIHLGYLDPVETLTGVQQRLANLGYDCGRDDGELGELTKAALSAFQADNDLRETGIVDDTTRVALESKHRS